MGGVCGVGVTRESENERERDREKERYKERAVPIKHRMVIHQLTVWT
jgi:hypothetical protein